MTKLVATRVRNLAVPISLLVATMAPTFTRAAAAAEVVCAPNVIEYFNATLIIQCAPTNYYAQTYPPAAPCEANVNFLDNMKMWMTLAQSALLAGKNLKIGYTTCGPTNYINVIDLIK
jgi:hypothetical protein